MRFDEEIHNFYILVGTVYPFFVILTEEDHTADSAACCVVFLLTVCYLDLSHLLWHSVSLQGGVIWVTYLKSSGMGI